MCVRASVCTCALLNNIFTWVNLFMNVEGEESVEASQ